MMDKDLERLYTKIDKLEKTVNNHVKRVEVLERYKEELERDVSSFKVALEKVLKMFIGFFGGI